MNKLGHRTDALSRVNGKHLDLIDDLTRQPESTVLMVRDIPRLHGIVSHVKENGIPPNLFHLKKFSGEKKPYTPEELLPPEILYVRGFDPHLLTQEHALFGFTGGLVYSGAVGPLTSSVMKGVSNFDIKSVIVSGGANGTDHFAHSAAVDERLRVILSRPTIVMNGDIEKKVSSLDPETGLETDFWRSLRGSGMVGRDSNDLVRKVIAQGGMLMSEYPDFVPDFGVHTKRLLQRDRMVSGSSDAVFVLESIERSGTVDTAKKGIIQGKKVVVIDWHNIVDFKGDIAEYERWKSSTGNHPPLDGSPFSRVMEFEDLWKNNFQHVPRIEGNDFLLSKLNGQPRGTGLFKDLFRYPQRELSLDEIPNDLPKFLGDLRLMRPGVIF